MSRVFGRASLRDARYRISHNGEAARVGEGTVSLTPVVVPGTLGVALAWIQ